MEHKLAKVGVEGSNPFARSNKINSLDSLFPGEIFQGNARVTVARQELDPLEMLSADRHDFEIPRRDTVASRFTWTSL